MIDLYLLNLATWFSPLALTKGLKKTYLLIAVTIISSSYWFYLPISDIIDQQYSKSIIESNLRDSLTYSAIAGLAFNLFYLFSAGNKKITTDYRLVKSSLSIIKTLPGANLRLPLKIFATIILFISYLNAIPYIGRYDRIQWIESAAGNTHALLTFLSSMIILYCTLLDNKATKNISFVTLLIVVFHIFIVGFDGSRRAAFTSIIGYLIIYISNTILQKTVYDYKSKKEIYIFAILALLINYLAINRSFHVGWSILAGYDQIPSYAFKAFISSIFSPMPTLHVNTHMIEYVKVFGDQGYTNYISAILNTLFPRFIFGEYLFGAPLVTQLHEKLGWFGFDFGFLAESIYSGGVFGVIIMHSILGLTAGLILRGAAKGKSFSLCLALGFIFSLLNGLRSDFMNFSKAFLYLSVALYFLGSTPKIVRKIIR